MRDRRRLFPLRRHPAQALLACEPWAVTPRPGVRARDPTQTPFPGGRPIPAAPAHTQPPALLQLL